MALIRLKKHEAPEITWWESRPKHRMWRFPRKGGGEWFSDEITLKKHDRLVQLQMTQPVAVATIEHLGKTYWWYKDEYYMEDDGHSSQEVQLLLWERVQKHKRKLERLRKEMLSERAIDEARRETIPEDVRIFVWRRDGGRCVQCGSQENLEFDHIIPVSKGGSNTARNIQLLCETCNRRKSDNI